MTDRHGVYARQAAPGYPIEVGWWGENGARFQFVSDDEALRLASDLTKFVLGNLHAKGRPCVESSSNHHTEATTQRSSQPT